MKNFLKESAPAKEFSDAHYLGNGRLGATVYGNVGVEKIVINDDTLWSGYEQPIERPEYYDHLQVARDLTLQGKYAQVNAYMDENMTGSWCQTYLPLGVLNFTYGLGSNFRTSKTKIHYGNGHKPISNYENYSRILDIDQAVSTVSYTHNGIEHERESFISHDYQVMAIKITAKNGALRFATSLKSELRSTLSTQDNFVCVCGRAPDNAEPQYTTVEPGVVYFEDGINPTLQFAACAVVAETDGEVTTDCLRTYVNDASYAVILMAAGTNYEGYQVPRNRTAQDVLQAQKELLIAAQKVGYDALKMQHVKDYKALYDRVSIDLGEPLTDHLDTSKRIERYIDCMQDPALTALQVQYARYLMISGSRKGCMPLTLQGLWNESVRPAWSCNFTANINVQMNYWPAEVLNLSDCHESLLEYIYTLAKDGEETAKHFFHAAGWVAHHNLDIWGHSAPVCETTNFSYEIFCGVWLCQHVWAHYLYTQDKEFLKRFYPVLRGAAEFFLSQLVEDETGYLVTAPSNSPESRHIDPEKACYKDLVENVAPENRMASRPDAVCSMCKGSTVDMTMAHEIVDNLLEAAKVLEITEEFLAQAKSAKEKLRPFQIGRHGQLMEWDVDFEECAPGFSHVVFLYGVYPGNVINKYDDPVLFEAAKNSFKRKRAHHGFQYGWPGGWGLPLAARFGMPETCLEICNTMGKDFGAGMLGKGFQAEIDAIFGLGAGVAEMLLQSYCDRVVLLPCVPSLWWNGAYKGLMARGGFEIDAKWEQGALIDATVKSLYGNPLNLQAKGLRAVVCDGETLYQDLNDTVTFDTQKEKTYTLLFKGSV